MPCFVSLLELMLCTGFGEACVSTFLGSSKHNAWLLSKTGSMLSLAQVQSHSTFRLTGLQVEQLARRRIVICQHLPYLGQLIQLQPQQKLLQLHFSNT
eukprot:6482952-Amphidinium_carterae.1